MESTRFGLDINSNPDFTFKTTVNFESSRASNCILSIKSPIKLKRPEVTKRTRDGIDVSRHTLFPDDDQLSTSSHRRLCPSNSYPMSETLVGTPLHRLAAPTNARSSGKLPLAAYLPSSM